MWTTRSSQFGSARSGSAKSSGCRVVSGALQRGPASVASPHGRVIQRRASANSAPMHIDNKANQAMDFFEEVDVEQVAGSADALMNAQHTARTPLAAKYALQQPVQEGQELIVRFYRDTPVVDLRSYYQREDPETGVSKAAYTSILLQRSTWDLFKAELPRFQDAIRTRQIVNAAYLGSSAVVCEVIEDTHNAADNLLLSVAMTYDADGECRYRPGAPYYTDQGVAALISTMPGVEAALREMEALGPQGWLAAYEAANPRRPPVKPSLAKPVSPDTSAGSAARRSGAQATVTHLTLELGTLYRAVSVVRTPTRLAVELKDPTSETSTPPAMPKPDPNSPPTPAAVASPIAPKKVVLSTSEWDMLVAHMQPITAALQAADSAYELRLLSPRVRVRITTYTGSPTVDVRQFFIPDSTPTRDWLPTKKGITLRPDQWQRLMDYAPLVNQAIQAAEASDVPDSVPLRAAPTGTAASSAAPPFQPST